MKTFQTKLLTSTKFPYNVENYNKERINEDSNEDGRPKTRMIMPIKPRFHMFPIQQVQSPPPERKASKKSY